MNEREILERLGKRNRKDENGNPVNLQIPLYTMTGTRATSNQIRKGLGRYWFVCYPDNTYRPSDEELKPFKDYVAKATVTDGIPLESVPVKTVSQVSKSKD